MFLYQHHEYAQAVVGLVDSNGGVVGQREKNGPVDDLDRHRAQARGDQRQAEAGEGGIEDPVEDRLQPEGENRRQQDQSGRRREQGGPEAGR